MNKRKIGIIISTIAVVAITASVIFAYNHSKNNSTAKNETVAAERAKSSTDDTTKDESKGQDTTAKQEDKATQDDKNKDSSTPGVTITDTGNSSTNSNSTSQSSTDTNKQQGGTSSSSGSSKSSSSSTSSDTSSSVSNNNKNIGTPASTVAVTPQPSPKPAPAPQPSAPAPQPSAPAPQPAAPTQNYDETIVVPGPIRNDYNGAYGENKEMSDEVSSKNSVTYDGKWQSKMNETHRKLSAGYFNEQDVKNIWLGKYIDGKYKVSNIQVIVKGAPWSNDNTIKIFEPTGIWNPSPTSSIHFDKTLVYYSNKPDFKATRLVIDLQPIK